MKTDQNKQTSFLDEYLWYGMLFTWLMIVVIGFQTMSSLELVPYSTFITYANQGKLDEVVIEDHEITGTYKADGQGHRGFRTARIEDPQLADRLMSHGVMFRATLNDSFWKTIMVWSLPAFLLIMLVGNIIPRAISQNGPTAALAIEKNRSKTYMESNIQTTFADVAGVDEAKEELQEIIGFLKEPARYTRLGGHMPKGVLLVGPPGTGKTLLARAVAGEAGVPFFSISGSEFVELYVGVGAARVRDLFSQAQSSAPCIIFIDELDALGRARGLYSSAGGHDEKEQTLNQLLVEMDGFDSRQGVVLLAATNRPEILDAALLRAGRFDRHVLVDSPDKSGRLQILNVHLRNVTCDEALQVEEIAASTTGFTGADLANLVNEAVLLATRRSAATVQSQDFTAALERIVAGLEKRNRLLNQHERTVVAYHEMGHALVSLSIAGSDPIQKVSIIPRGIGALGYTMQRPTEDRYLVSRQELEGKLAILLGGRAAELLAFTDISTGAADDLSKATAIARSMATRYGMSNSLGPVAYENDPQPYLGNPQMPFSGSKQFSEETAREIDCAIRGLIKQALERAVSILQDRRSELDLGATQLLSKETLTQEDLLSLLPKTTSTIRDCNGDSTEYCPDDRPDILQNSLR